MAKLLRKDNSEVLVADLKIAERFFSRMKGLLGTKDLSEQQGLWIHHCNNIHTFFMMFAIDCIFLDESMKVLKVVQNVVPFRFAGALGASSVVELKAGLSSRMNLKNGEQLHVGN